ncbi:MAG: response regulator [Candidatus Hodarchaeales archaeon]
MDKDKFQNKDDSNKIIKVLFIDDDENFLKMAKIILERTNKDIKVETTTSPEYVFYCVKVNKFDIIISDYLMPNQDGLTILKNVRKTNLDIPFILLTGHGREEIAIQALNLGADYYLQKGIDFNTLFAELNNFIVKSIEKQKALRAKKYAEEVLLKQNENTSLYLDIVTHDLNGYHFATKTFLELILGDYFLPEDSKVIIQKAIKNVVRANALINNITVMMQSEIPLSHELQPINILSSLERIKKDLFSLFPGRDIIIETGSIPDTNILADLLFEQLILNIFTNSIRNDAHKVVTILIDLEQKNGYCLLKITDQGSGIAPEEQKKIMSQLSKLERTTVGRGVGLSIVKALVDRYQGHLWIENRVIGDYTKGTRFTFKFRLAESIATH